MVQKGELRVALPVVITIDDFEWLEASLENFSLGDFLRDYAPVADRFDIRDFVFKVKPEYAARMRNPGIARDVARELVEHVADAWPSD